VRALLEGWRVQTFSAADDLETSAVDEREAAVLQEVARALPRIEGLPKNTNQKQNKNPQFFSLCDDEKLRTEREKMQVPGR